MVTVLKVLLAIAIIVSLFYFALNLLGLRLNSSWFRWAIKDCPSEIKAFGSDACERWKNNAPPLFEHKVF